MRLLDIPQINQNDESTIADCFVIRVEGIAHEVIKFDWSTISATLACDPCFAVLINPYAVVYEHGEVDIDCMACLVKGSRW